VNLTSALAFLGAIALTPAHARGPLSVDLKFIPTTATGSAAPTLDSAALSRSVAVRVRDDRAGDLAVVGEGTDDDDSTFEVRSTTPLTPFAGEVFTRMAREWGLRVADPGELVLDLAITRWSVSERNQAVGAMYAAEVGLRGELQAADGRSLWRGVALGDTRRYGKKQNPVNYNECMSDAAQEAMANLLSISELQQALQKAGIAAGVVTADPKIDGPAGSSGAKTSDPNDVLAEVVALQEKGFSPGFLLEFVRKKSYSRELSTDDLVKWKEAGLSEAVIMGAMEASR
jgi:hypothetical protein